MILKLTGAKLVDTDLTRSNLTRSNLTRSNLTRSNLTRSNLTRANLTGADVTNVRLSRVLWTLETTWPDDIADRIREDPTKSARAPTVSAAAARNPIDRSGPTTRASS